MSIIEAIILGFIQGLTEFLPVSSSGHLKLAQHLFNLKNLHQYIVFDLVCHLGTLLAIFYMFWREIVESFTTNKLKLIQIILGTLPLFPLLLMMKPIKAIFNDPHYLGVGFLITSALLYLGIKFQNVKNEKVIQKHRFRDPLIIGCFQSAAILPGISRSGSTITAAKILGWPKEHAIAFSFLLAIPAILGGTFIELIQLTSQGTWLPSVSLMAYLFAFITSFAAGYFSLSLLKKVASNGKFMYFVWYCLIIGILTTLYI